MEKIRQLDVPSLAYHHQTPILSYLRAPYITLARLGTTSLDATDLERPEDLLLELDSIGMTRQQSICMTEHQIIQIRSDHIKPLRLGSDTVHPTPYSAHLMSTEDETYFRSDAPMLSPSTNFPWDGAP